MTTVAAACNPPRRLGSASFTLTPTAIFIAASVVILGGVAANAAHGHWMHQPNRDLWQHLAALRSLIADPGHPTNPFVNTDEPSRHFHPYWAIMAAVARAFRLTLFQTIGVASFVSVTVLAVGYYSFGRAYFRSAWGPLALLLSSMLAWSLPLSHTGYINVPTLVEGAGYPAVLLVGLSMILWSLVIGALSSPARIVGVLLVSALMFSIHPLGAGLGYIVAGPLALFFPEGTLARRAGILGAIVGGVLLSTFWIYYNPIKTVIEAGNPTWMHGVPFYHLSYLVAIFVPSAIGLAGFRQPNFGGRARPLLISLAILLCGYLAGADGFLIGTRFGAAAALVLQVGIAALLVPLFERPDRYRDRTKLAVAAAAFGIVVFQAMMLGLYLYPSEYKAERKFGNVFQESQAISADIPDSQEVAAYDVAAFPLAAAGQKVHSIPWPEPLIHDLPNRQKHVEELFDVKLSRDSRLTLAKSLGIRTLVLDQRFGPLDEPREWQPAQIRIFFAQAKCTIHIGPLWRFDLY